MWFLAGFLIVVYTALMASAGPRAPKRDRGPRMINRYKWQQFPDGRWGWLHWREPR